jgi:cytosine/adenosine deaminase-related metal-dependent hydrolase
MVGVRDVAGAATVIDAEDCIVMPGFIDTHHHPFETALRGSLKDLPPMLTCRDVLHFATVGWRTCRSG